MDNIVPSRFSCLKVDDEEFQPVTNKSNKKRIESKQPAKKANSLTTTKKPPGKKEHSSNVIPKKKSKAKNDTKQWEDWQRKDNEYINENFEQDLQSAILQSRLDYENRKKNYVPEILTQNQDKNMKKKKTKTMSLDQFLEGDGQTSKKEIESKTQENDEDFFESVVHSAKEELRKEKVEEKRRERANNIEEVISLAQCQEKLQKERRKSELLQEELDEARKEITIVKKRNKTLCSMLSQGEMKGKAEILLELEKLTTVKEELTEEVARLHKSLEQERSKSNSSIANATSESHTKQKNKKKT